MRQASKRGDMGLVKKGSEAHLTKKASSLSVGRKESSLSTARKGSVSKSKDPTKPNVAPPGSSPKEKAAENAEALAKRKEGLAHVLNKVSAKPPAEEVLVRFAQRLGGKQYDTRGDAKLLRPLIFDTLIRWCASSHEHKCVPLMLQATSALASLASDKEDAEMIVSLGGMDMLMRMMQEGSGPEKNRFGDVELLPVTSSGLTWRQGSGMAAVCTVWALIQNPATIRGVIEAGAIRPLIRLCKETEEEVQLRQTTGAIMDMSVNDQYREEVVREGGLDALKSALDKTSSLPHLERGAPTIKRHVAQALQNLSLSATVRLAFVSSGILPPLMALCVATDRDKKLTTPNQVLASCVAAVANLTFESSLRNTLLDLGLARFLCQLLDVCKNGLVVMHVCVGIRNLAMRAATPDFQQWLSDADERNQLEFGAANALKHLVDLVQRHTPPNNDNTVLEHVLNALVTLTWSCPKNRMRMSNKDVIDITILTKIASDGPRLNAAIRQRLAILLADVAQLGSVQTRLADSGLLDSMFLWMRLPREEEITRFCAAGATMNMVANPDNAQRYGAAMLACSSNKSWAFVSAEHGCMLVEALLHGGGGGGGGEGVGAGYGKSVALDSKKSYIAALAAVFDERPPLPTLVMNTAGILANLAYRNDSNRARIWQAGVVQALLQSLVLSDSRPGSSARPATSSSSSKAGEASRRLEEMEEEGREVGRMLQRGVAAPQSKAEALRLRRDIMIAALLQNLSAGSAFRGKLAQIGAIGVLLQIITKGHNKDMVRCALGALRNLALEPSIHRVLVEQGALDACVHVRMSYGEKDSFDDGTSPVEHAAAILRSLSTNDSIRLMVRKNNTLHALAKLVDSSGKSVCEESVKAKPELNPAEVMCRALVADGNILKERFGTTDAAAWAFPLDKYDGALSCNHLAASVEGRTAWEVLVDVLSKVCDEDRDRQAKAAARKAIANTFLSGQGGDEATAEQGGGDEQGPIGAEDGAAMQETENVEREGEEGYSDGGGAGLSEEKADKVEAEAMATKEEGELEVKVAKSEVTDDNIPTDHGGGEEEEVEGLEAVKRKVEQAMAMVSGKQGVEGLEAVLSQAMKALHKAQDESVVRTGADSGVRMSEEVDKGRGQVVGGRTATVGGEEGGGQGEAQVLGDMEAWAGGRAEVDALMREMRELLRRLPEERAWEVVWGLGSEQSHVSRIARTLGALAVQGAWRGHVARRRVRDAGGTPRERGGEGARVRTSRLWKGRGAVSGRRVGGWGLTVMEAAVAGMGREAVWELRVRVASVVVQSAWRAHAARRIVKSARASGSTRGGEARAALEAEMFEQDEGVTGGDGGDGKEVKEGDVELAVAHGFVSTPTESLLRQTSHSRPKAAD